MDRLAARNPQATYACVNLGEAYAPPVIAARSLCLDADIGEVLGKLAARLGARAHSLESGSRRAYCRSYHAF